jgi:hypothetical protein
MSDSKNNPGTWASHRIILIAGLAVGAVTLPAAHAGEIGFGFGYVGAYSDNIRRAEGGSEEELTHALLGGLAYRENSADLAARLLGQVEYRDYSRNTYDDETVLLLDAAAVWTINPQRLIWTLEDRFDQLPQDATLADTPDNREAVNVFNTGPDLLLPLTPVDTLVVGARVGHSYFRESDVDHNRYAGIVRLRHLAGPSTSYSLNLETIRVQYTDLPEPPAVSPVADYLREDLFMRMDRRTLLSRLVLDAGLTRIVPDTGDDYDGPLARLNWAQRVSSESSVGIAGGLEYQDVSGALLAGLADPTVQDPITAPPQIPQTVTSGDIFYHKRAEVYYTRTGLFVGFRINVFYRDRDYEHVAQDQIARGGRTDWSYNFTETLTGNLYGEATRTDYQDFVRIDRDVNYGAWFGYRLNPNVSLRLEGRRYERRSAAALADYEETRAYLSLLYSSSPIFTLTERR